MCPSWALVAAASLTIGYVGLTALDGSQALAFSLADDPNVDLPGLAKTLDDDWLPMVLKIGGFGGWHVGLGAVIAGSALLWGEPLVRSRFRPS